jgi:7-cyano-7-deazaguanine synthase
MNESALVIFSGGQDSTTCLAWALDRFDEVMTIGFSYGQRHHVEMDCRKEILQSIGKLNSKWASKLKHDEILNISLFNEIGGTALTEDVQITMGKNGLPTTFVPGRNLIFLTAAAAYAYRQGIRHIILGVCETDFSGYPDCRDDTMKAMQVALNLGMESRFAIHTPLMWIDKAETWELAHKLGGTPFVDFIREQTHTCYLGDRTKRQPWGYGCGKCPACELRAKGWEIFSEKGTSNVF